MKIVDAPISRTELAAMAAGRWQAFSLVEQLANVGSEVERALSWAAWGNAEYSRNAFERGQKLMEFTIADPKHRGRLRELTRLREVLLDCFLEDNEYESPPENRHSYFHAYGMAAAMRRLGS
jgi:hypothetical protein